MGTITVALISGGLSFLGVVVTVMANNKTITNKITNQLEKAQAVTDTKIEELTREVREHNNFAKRMPVVENEIKHIENDIHKLQSYHTSGGTQ